MARAGSLGSTNETSLRGWVEKRDVAPDLLRRLTGGLLVGLCDLVALEAGAALLVGEVKKDMTDRVTMLRAWAVAGAVAIGLLAWLTPAAVAQDTTTMLSKFLVDLRAGTLGATQTFSTITATGRITSSGASGGMSVNQAADLGFTSRSFFTSPADGVILVQNNAANRGVRMQFGNIPTISSGFGTTPSVVAGSTDTAFSVNVGTGGVATSGVIAFANTWSVAPVCIAQDTITVGAGVQKVATTTSQATITTAVAWTASDVVAVLCFGAK